MKRSINWVYLLGTVVMGVVGAGAILLALLPPSEDEAADYLPFFTFGSALAVAGFSLATAICLKRPSCPECGSRIRYVLPSKFQSETSDSSNPDDDLARCFCPRCGKWYTSPLRMVPDLYRLTMGIPIFLWGLLGTAAVVYGFVSGDINIRRSIIQIIFAFIAMLIWGGISIMNGIFALGFMCPHCRWKIVCSD